MIGIPASRGILRMRSSTVKPSPAGRPRSSTIRSGCSRCAAETAETPSPAKIGAYLLALRRTLIARRWSASSSTTRIFLGGMRYTPCRRHRQGEVKDAAAARRALGPDPAALPHDQIAADVQADAETLAREV